MHNQFAVVNSIPGSSFPVVTSGAGPKGTAISERVAWESCYFKLGITLHKVRSYNLIELHSFSIFGNFEVNIFDNF